MALLSTIVAWLSKRFPEQLTVTRQDWTELRQEVASYNVLHQNQQQIVEQLTSLKKQVDELNKASGFVNQGKGSFRLER